MNQIKEKNVKAIAEVNKIVTKDLKTFYNPIMELNRTSTIEILNNYFSKDITIALPLAASGIRAFRILKECKNIKEIHVNDIKDDFKNIIKKGLKLNKFKKSDKIKISNTEANIFLRKKGYYDYIDIDPYGSPIPFLQSAISRVKNQGLLAITATDTSSLAGSYPLVCKRRYWATPLRNYLKHEIGLRILIRAAQLTATQQNRALIPLLSYSKEHYMRVIFKVRESKSLANEIIKKHEYFLYCKNCSKFKTVNLPEKKCSCKSDYEIVGPLWTGQLGDFKLISEFEDEFFKKLSKEYEIGVVGFFDTHNLGKIYKINIPKKQKLITMIKKTKPAIETHFIGTGIRTNMKLTNLLKLLNQ